MHNALQAETLVLIPSLDPDKNLLNFVCELQKEGFNRIVIVDDGSRNNVSVFDDLKSNNVIVLRHAVNQGKGRALKTGINYILNNYAATEIIGVITADADGQHSAYDTKRVAQKLVETGKVIFGCRDFNSENVPFKSSIGNKITSGVFGFLYGKKISDTQTGLRGIPFDFLAESMKCTGERFEYEIDFLIKAVESKREIIEVPIETIYYEGNRATHFSPVKDSFKIYKNILSQGLKYIISSISSFVLDISLFAILTKLVFFTMSVPLSAFLGTIIARVISATYNYNINKKAVFKSAKKNSSTAPKYALLAGVQMFLSWLLVVGVYSQVNFDTTVIKVVVDTCLFIINFQIQKRVIF